MGFAAASAGKVKLEEAGDDDVANTDDDDFTDDANPFWSRLWVDPTTKRFPVRWG